MIRLDSRPKRVEMAGSSRAADRHPPGCNPVSLVRRVLSRNMPFSRPNSRSSYKHVDTGYTSDGDRVDGDLSDDDAPRPHRPLVKTFSGNSAKKQFTVINYGQVEAGYTSAPEATDRRRNSYIEFTAHKPISGKPSSSDFRSNDALHSVESLRGLEFRAPSLTTISNNDLRRPSIGNELFPAHQLPQSIPHEKRQHFAPEVYSRHEHRRHSLAPSFARRASHTPTIFEFEDDESEVDSSENAHRKKSVPNGILDKYIPSYYSLDIEKGLPGQLSTQRSLSSSYPLKQVARRGRLFSKRKQFRIVSKQGDCNIGYVNVERRGFVVFHDIFTTVLNLQWRYNILLFILIFTVSWVLFALLWWAIVAAHHDRVSNDNDCVSGVNDFVSALLFSIETQQTIGYGTRATSATCPDAVILMTIQTLFGVFIQCVVTGVIFAKVARPKRRAGAFIFSHNAVIYKNDGELCLIFRVGDTRKSQMMGVSVNALLVRAKVTKEGEMIDRHQINLKVSTESDSQFYFLAWPIKVVHKIDQDSPFWDMSTEEILTSDFEIIFILEATCETTGMTTQVRTSYLPSEILWGYHLAPLNTYKNVLGNFIIDFTHFNDTIPADTPEYSAKEQQAMHLKSVAKLTNLSSMCIENET